MDIVLFSSADFDFIRTRKQQVAVCLSHMGHRVLYIEPPRAGKWCNPPQKHCLLRKLSRNLHVFSPPVLPGMGRFHFINKINYQLILYHVKKIITKLEFKDHLLWIYPPRASFFYGKTGEKLRVFDCIQYWPESSEPEEIKNKVPEILRQSDIVFAPDHHIADYCRKFNDTAVLVPHGADSSFLKKREETLCEVSSLSHPVIGISASLSSSWIDFSLISEIAEKKPDWSIVLAGPLISGENIDFLLQKKNVCYLGCLKHPSLVRAISGFDICLIPYKDISALKGILPLKFFDYIASGKPVISTLPLEFPEYAEFVKVAKTADLIISEAETEIRKDSDFHKQRRIESARKSTWNQRVSSMLSFISKAGETHH